MRLKLTEALYWHRVENCIWDITSIPHTRAKVYVSCRPDLGHMTMGWLGLPAILPLSGIYFCITSNYKISSIRNKQLFSHICRPARGQLGVSCTVLFQAVGQVELAPRSILLHISSFEAQAEGLELSSVGRWNYCSEIFIPPDL